ncbi:DcrB-related protein [Enterobacter hormaechei]|uniref:DcrB-related protein n=1 Tax=Enterobacter hormaechei TaxID=158836 RepID=UPI003752B91B
MSEPSSQCLFNEGMIAFPEGYQDRTVNVFAPPAADAPAFNISRDALNPGEALAAYIDRQLALMAKHIKGWKQGERSTATLGDSLLQGETVHASYLRDGKRIWQQQAVFNVDGDKILVFTMTCTRAPGDADGALFGALLRSFRFHH